MPYATQEDIVRLYSQNALFVADRDGDGVPEDGAIDVAVFMDTYEIDSFLGVRYSTPVDPIPDLLMQFCVDMALYRLASSRDMRSEEHRRRYDDAVAHLKQIGAGKAALILPTVSDDTDTSHAHCCDDTVQSPPGTPQPIVAAGPDREFTREKMEGL